MLFFKSSSLIISQNYTLIDYHIQCYYSRWMFFKYYTLIKKLLFNFLIIDIYKFYRKKSNKMNHPISIILSSTFHDPQFKLKSLLKSALPLIKDLFSKLIVICTPATGDDVSDFLTHEGFKVATSSSMRQIDNYKKAVKVALNFIESPQTEKIFYIDFDRLIHWINTYPDEITKTLKGNIDVDYLHIGRTSRAFNTHPITQRETEIIMNELGSKALGLLKTIDIISVCFLFTKELGEKIIKIKNYTTTGFYCTWPVIFWKLASKKRYVEVEGHEWETPDRFKIEIAKYGYKEWLKQYQTSTEWKKRVQFLHDSILELSRIVDFQFHLKE